jgi:two-component system chemotaxis sensor kinase CheA
MLGQQQVVIKSLEANYRSIAGISAATILGDGKVALIIDVNGLRRMTGPAEAAAAIDPMPRRPAATPASHRSVH